MFRTAWDSMSHMSYDRYNNCNERGWGCTQQDTVDIRTHINIEDLPHRFRNQTLNHPQWTSFFKGLMNALHNPAICCSSPIQKSCFKAVKQRITFTRASLVSFLSWNKELLLCLLWKTRQSLKPYLSIPHCVQLVRSRTSSLTPGSSVTCRLWTNCFWHPAAISDSSISFPSILSPDLHSALKSISIYTAHTLTQSTNSYWRACFNLYDAKTSSGNRSNAHVK